MAKPAWTTDKGELRYRILIYADQETKDALQRLAAQSGQTPSQVMRELVKQAVGKKGEFRTLPAQ